LAWVLALPGPTIADAGGPEGGATPPHPYSASYGGILPAPVSAVPEAGVSYTLAPAAAIGADVPAIGDYLAAILRRSTGYPVPGRPGSAGPAAIALLLSGAPASVGAQGYQLEVTSSGVTVRAGSEAGLFAGVQTLLDLLPAPVRSPTVQPGPWTLA